jgi:hypothetical protein
VEPTFFSALGSCKNPARKPVRAKRGAVRPHYCFRFDDQWTFRRTVAPSLPRARDCERIAFNGDFDALARQARRPLSRVEADLAWVALAVYLADRFAPRYPYGVNGPNFWRRRLHLQIPVSNRNMWENASERLIHALAFLTEDDWSFEFEGGRAHFPAESQEHFRKMRGPRIEWTSLFSGGLDSLAGALRWLSRTSGVGLLISGQTHNRIAAGQEAQVTELRRHFREQIEYAGVGYGVPEKHGLTGFESSQRTRAFIHTTLGSLAAIMAGCRELLLFENGFGAMNLPCDAAQLGSQNSRAAHPVFLRRMAAFVGALFSQSFVIANPFTFSTKSQMLAAPGMQRFVGLFQKSFSCDRYPNYPHKAPQCGCCASCLVRRLSFHAAGLPDDSENYSTNIARPRRPLRESELVALTKLTVQADTLASVLHPEEPWEELCETWPDLLRAEIELGARSFTESIVALLRRHVAEWQSFTGVIAPLLPPSRSHRHNTPIPWNPNSSAASTQASLANA